MTYRKHIFVSYGVIGSRACLIIDGLSLYKILGIRIPFKKWVIKRISDYGFQAGVDYEVLNTPLGTDRQKSSTNHRSYSNYIFTMDMARQLCSARNNPKSKKALQLLQSCETQAFEGGAVSSLLDGSPFAAIRAAACSLQRHLYKAGEASREFGRKSGEYTQHVLQNKKLHPSHGELLGKLDRANNLTFQALDDLAEGIVRNIEIMRILVEDMM